MLTPCPTAYRCAPRTRALPANVRSMNARMRLQPVEITLGFQAHCASALGAKQRTY